MGKRHSARRRVIHGASSLFVAFHARLVWAHSTVLPHHRQDLEDLATGRDKRGIVVLVTFAFVAVITSLVAFLIRQTKTAKPVEDVRAGQERLRRNVMHVATTVRPLLGRPTREVVSRAVQVYARIARGSPPSSVGDAPCQEFRFGDDVVTVEVASDDGPPAFRIRATTETAGAEVSLFADGRSSISVFAVHDEAYFAPDLD